MNKSAFAKKLRILNEVGNELALSKSVRELCRRMVRSGRSRLGFDRISTWFIGKNPKFIIGSYGVDEKGRIREETGQRVRIDADKTVKEIHDKKMRSILKNNVALCDNSSTMVGTGSHMLAAIWDGKKVIGYISTDNLLNRKRFTKDDRELFELLAATFGHLYSLKRTEEALVSAFEKVKDTRSQLIQAAKMEVVGSLASGVAHEVKNPLAVILQGIDYISKKVSGSDPNGHDVLRRMRNSVKKADCIIKGLLDFSILTELEFIPQDIHSIVERSLRLLSYEIDKYNILVHRRFAKDLPDVRLDKNKIEQVLVNILLNAINGMHEGGEILIRTYIKGHGRSKKLCLEIEDNGPGIPESIIGKIFDPFFTTRRAIGGTGLGLTIAHNIMEMHKGKIFMDNKEDGRGVRATILFKI